MMILSSPPDRRAKGLRHSSRGQHVRMRLKMPCLRLIAPVSRRFGFFLCLCERNWWQKYSKASQAYPILAKPAQVHPPGADQLVTTLRPVGQLLLLGRSRPGGRRTEGLAIIRQYGRVNRVGFSTLALGTGEMTDPPSLQDTDRDACGLQGAHDTLFITAGGFTNDLGVRMSAQAFEELGMPFGIIGQRVETSGQMELQRELGNVQTNIEDVCIVLTHTCRMRATIFELSCSNNGSSLGQWARVKHAPGRITSKRMPGAKVPTRTIIRPVATGRMTPAWLPFSKLPSRTNRKIQGGRVG